jgi:hypothetical protein
VDNKVGDNVPKQKKLDEIYATLNGAITELAKFCITLSDEERISRLKPRRGAEPMVEKANDLSKRYGVTVAGVPVEGMMNDVHLSRAIRPFVTLLDGASQMASDTLGQSQSEYWQAFLAYYGAINNASGHNPALAGEAKELVEFMRAFARKKTQEEPKEP